MLKELESRPECGFISATIMLGFTYVIQYWRSIEHCRKPLQTAV